MKKTKKYILISTVHILSLITPVTLLMLNMAGIIKIPWIALGIIALCCIVIFKITKKIYRKVRKELEYDEFGQSNSLDIYDLSKAERRQYDLVKLSEMEAIISKDTLRTITKKGSKNPEDDLNKLIGLDNVKEKIDEMQARYEFELKDRKKNKKNQDNGQHMVFFGPAGTGKTTVARIVTGLLYKYRYIKYNQYIEIDGNFLKSGTPANSAIKTRVVIKHAIGKVLFIDEAYALMQDDDGLSVIATLIKEMEDNRGKFIVILAGYKEEMKQLLSANTGFSSRINNYLYFSDYDQNDLNKILIFMAGEKGFAVNEDVFTPFEIRISKEKQLKTYGNARTVRNILSEMIDRHALNYKRNNLPKEKKYMLSADDISTSIKENIYI